MVDKNDVMKALSTVEDPELHKSLTELDMVKSVDIENDNVKVEVTLTIPGCPLKKKIDQDVTDAIMKLDGVKSVEVTFGAMTDEQRKNLATRIYGKDYQKQTAEGPQNQGKQGQGHRLWHVATHQGVNEHVRSINVCHGGDHTGHRTENFATEQIGADGCHYQADDVDHVERLWQR